MKVALVYDRVNKIGGAERVLVCLHNIFPKAPLYTSFYNYKKASWAKEFKVKTSFLQFIRFLPHEIMPNLMPLAFKSFDFKDFDLVLSVSSAEGKYIHIKKPTVHINYCLTPTRYLWSGYFDYLKEPGFGRLNKLAIMWFLIMSPLMRMKDFEEAQKTDKLIAISEEVKRRIKKYYRRESEVVYPPCPTVGARRAVPLQEKNTDYFLIVSRLVPYKQIDLAIRAFNMLKDKTLIIVGEGGDKSRLKKMAKNNIIFKGKADDKELEMYYNNCLALVFPGIEDFGLTSLEAQLFDKPVICRSKGGTKETVVVGKTGEIFETEEELMNKILEFDKKKYKPKDFQNNLFRFSAENFKKDFLKKIEKYGKFCN